MPATPQPDPRPSGTPGRSSVVPLNPAPASNSGRRATADDVPTIITPGTPGSSGLDAAPPADGFDLPPGTALAHFQVVGPLGAGGMASVYRAKDLTLGREVALKILPPELARDPDAVARFKHEARAAAKLNHEGVARVFFTGEDRGLHFIAFEFVEGETLRAAIDRLGTVPPADCLRYLLHTAAGLHHAADRGVVHRDVKPSNLVLTPDGRAKLIDMGLARSLEPAVNGGVTQSGTTLGTFDYISPEQAIDPRKADVRSDIYSLGCTFYHALTGRPPVPEGNAARKLAAHQAEPPTDPRILNPAVPDELVGVLDRMMAKNPDHRFQSAMELAAELSRVGRVLGVPLDGTDLIPVSALARTRPPDPLARRGLSPAVVLGGAAAVVAVLVLVSVWSRTPNPPPPPWADPFAARTTQSADPLDPPPVRTPPKVQTVATTDELVKVVKDGVPKLVLTPDAVYDLSATDGVTVNGKAVEWEVADGKTATVRVAAVPISDSRPGSLAFQKCDSVKVRGVRFEVVPTADADADDPVGVAFADVGKLDLSECRFDTDGSSSNGAGVHLARVGTLAARHCFFDLKRWSAVELVGPTAAAFTECGFAVIGAGVEVTAGPDAALPAAVSFRHATFLLLDDAAAVAVNGDARCDLTAGFSVFAAPTANPATIMMTDPERKAVVVRHDPAAGVTFTAADGQPNAVYRADLPAVVSGPAPEVLKLSPWAATPKADPAQPWAALELNPKLPALRAAAPAVLLGVRALPTEQQRLYADWPPPSPTAGAKVWYPNPPAEERAALPPNVFTDLAQAVAAVKGKDVLEVRGSGVIEVPQAVVLTDPKRAITVRPEKGSAPVLKPVADGRKDAALFRLEAGELILEGLAFQVNPAASDGTAAVVNVSGGKRCDFKNCVVTLDEQGDERAAAVALTDAADLMKRDVPTRPAVGFENCLVRGRGRLVRAAASFPADLSATNVAAAVSGPLFEFGPPKRSQSPGVLGVQLTHLTAVLGGPLFDLHAPRRSTEDRPTPVPVEVRADGCLFAPLESGMTPLVLLNGFDPSTAERGLTWTPGGSGNGFSGWTVYAEVPADDGAEAKRWDAAEWRRWAGERDGATGRAVWAKSPSADALTAVKPADLDPATTPFDPSLGAKTSVLPKVEE